MTTAIDANVLFDVFLSDAIFEKRSQQAIEECSGEGGLKILDPSGKQA